jgi:hypothetical protein
MKKILPAILFMLLQVSAFSILEYQSGDTLYVWAESGLNLRSQPQSSSDILQTIPFGEAVVALQGKNFYDRRNNSTVIFDRSQFKKTNDQFTGVRIEGIWVKVQFQGIEGFVFDGYLSSYPHPNRDKIKSPAFNLHGYLTTILPVRKFSEWDENQDSGLDKFIWENGAWFEGRYASGGMNFKYVFPEMPMEEAFLLALFFFPPDTYITQSDEHTIRFVHDLGELVIYCVHDAVVIYGHWAC